MIPSDEQPFFLLKKKGHNGVVVVTGEKTTQVRLVDIPRNHNAGSDMCTIKYDNQTIRIDTVSMIPFSQIREKSIPVNRDQNLKDVILTIKASEAHVYLESEFMKSLSDQIVDIELDGDIKFEIDESTFIDRLKRIISKELGNGEGSSFTTPRAAQVNIKNFTIRSALTIFHRLLEREVGHYWTFMFYDGDDNIFVGVSPERHMMLRGDIIHMNALSGTFQKRSDWRHNQFKEEFETFLQDKRQQHELFLNCDEKMKIMSQVCAGGGSIFGPVCIDLVNAIQTEYEIVGRRRFYTSENMPPSGLAVPMATVSANGFKDEPAKDGTTPFLTLIDCLRASMFTTSGIGLPINSVTSRLYDYERKCPRAYHSSACVLAGWNLSETRGGAYRDFMDSCVTGNGMLEIKKGGEIFFRSGATVSKDTIAIVACKMAESMIKLYVNRLLKLPNSSISTSATSSLQLLEVYETSRERSKLDSLLKSRNCHLSKFWMYEDGEAEAGMLGGLMQNLLEGLGADHTVTNSSNPDMVLYSDYLGPDVYHRGRALIMANKDESCYMVAHMLRRLGVETEVAEWKNFDSAVWGKSAKYYDFFVVANGPGSAKDQIDSDMKMRKRLVRKLLDQPSFRVLGISLGHELIAQEMGFFILKKNDSNIGDQKRVPMFLPDEDEIPIMFSNNDANSSEEENKLHNVDLDDSGKQIVTLASFSSSYSRMENVNKLTSGLIIRNEEERYLHSMKLPFAVDVPGTQKRIAEFLGSHYDSDEVEVAYDETSGELLGIRVTGRLVTFQYRPESILSPHGLRLLRNAVDSLMCRRGEGSPKKNGEGLIGGKRRTRNGGVLSSLFACC